MNDHVALRAGIPPFYVMDVWLAAAQRQRTHGDLVNLAAGQPSAGAPGPVRSAAAAALGRELTVPGVAQSVTLTRVSTLSTAMPAGEELGALATAGGTLVIHLAAHRIDAVVEELLTAGRAAETPVAVVAFVSWPQQVVLRGTLADIAGQVRQASVTRTAVIIVGDVLAADGFPDSYLYSAGRTRGTRH